MKLKIVLVISVLFCNLVFADNPQKLKIDEVTVFLKGAQLLSTTTINLSKGENEVVFTNVAVDVNNQSLSVNATNGVLIESATFRNDYLTAESISPRAKVLKDSIEIVTGEKQRLVNKIAMLDEQVEIIKANRKVGGNNTGLNTLELQKMLDLVDAKMEGILNQKNKNESAKKKVDELLDRMGKQLNEEQNKGQHHGGELVVRFFTNEATSSNITVSYIVSSASWTPIYDIRVNDINQPVKIYYKANIEQRTGVQWDNVKLSLSTGNPGEGVESPELNPLYLSFAVPRTYMKAKKAMANAAFDASNSVANGREEGNLLILDGVQGQKIEGAITADNSGINTIFDIDLPYTVPSDGQKHLVSIKKYDVPANYRYFAVPKLDHDVFLQAQITNWQDLNLLPGKTNVFYEGTYVGQGDLDVRNVKDTFTFSLGRDKKIVVKRERDLKYRDVKFIGSNVNESFGYSITVHNTRKDKINLVVEDQQPVSNDKDIEVTDIETGGSTYDNKTGMMIWNVQLNPNETQTYHFGMTVRYPKGKTVDNMPK